MDKTTVKIKKTQRNKGREVLKTFKVTPSEARLFAAAKTCGYTLSAIARYGLDVLMADPTENARIIEVLGEEALND